ncbi:(deoxy)nucleoside triphosphate pyrophosphohydrolase [Corynebacterium mendelii]|uniref:8-oxo-dGTP diphosphatase n=1 Tax=Corynebacterium mendelii TaxID=2765362 RepID=A0A939E1D6_9CORY|nr:(deoxy)nucleoside triphosphate pyrophosphohydrolase [Corynebacterium mendelii]MBN9643682.1 (deoxy)nucleoside triphosphate pyrophosphohydrolase [Corynebacterium mendelii]
MADVNQSGHRTIEVVAAAIIDGDRVLAAKRGPGMDMPGHWEFPGGKIEEGETPDKALVRELREELRVVAEVGDTITTTVHRYPDKTITLTTFACTLVNGVPQATEHSEIRWVTAAEMAGLTWAPADREAVDKTSVLLAQK